MAKEPKSKVVTMDEAMEHCHSGMSILIPGFVNCGVPETLIKGIVAKGYKDLRVISNNTSVPGRGIGILVRQNLISHLTCSHIGNNAETVAKAVTHDINVTFVPQGSLCEKVRAGGAGLGGVLTPTGLGTKMGDGKMRLEVDGKMYILEKPLTAEVAIIHAWKADKLGNLVYRLSARNFNPIFATAAKYTIVEAEEIVEVGELDPNFVMTPFPFVDAIVQAETKGEIQ